MAKYPGIHEPRHEAKRLVFRPGPLQYLYILLLPAFLLFMSEQMIAYGFSARAQDWGARLPWAIGMAAPGLLLAAYFLGMKVEVDEDHVSKVFFFGWLRESIPREQLAASVETEHSENSSYSRYDFMSAEGRGAFSLYPTWVWRRPDVDAVFMMRTRPWPDASMKRQNWILTVGVWGLPVSSLLIVLSAIVLAISAHFFHWP